MMGADKRFSSKGHSNVRRPDDPESALKAGLADAYDGKGQPVYEGWFIQDGRVNAKSLLPIAVSNDCNRDGASLIVSIRNRPASEGGCSDTLVIVAGHELPGGDLGSVVNADIQFVVDRRKGKQVGQ